MIFSWSALKIPLLFYENPEHIWLLSCIYVSAQLFWTKPPFLPASLHHFASKLVLWCDVGHARVGNIWTLKSVYKFSMFILRHQWTGLSSLPITLRSLIIGGWNKRGVGNFSRINEVRGRGWNKKDRGDGGNLFRDVGFRQNSMLYASLSCFPKILRSVC